MRLLRAEGDELVLETAYGDSNKYAILSHRWLPEDDQEVRYADIVNQKDDLKSKPGWNKLQWCRQQAAADGLPHVCADTACIDKSSSQELTESINSMYQWYKDAEVCYVYLQDMPDSETWPIESGSTTTDANVADALSTDETCLLNSADVDSRPSAIWDSWDRDAFARCTWFTRAWTLQEMIAPARVKFYSQSWRVICNLDDIVPDIAELTGVHESLWKEQRSLSTFSVAQKISWASARTSTKVEDRAYSLLGLLGASMPVVYGEGANAFQRLQEEILRTGSDDSIFAFRVPGELHKIGPFETACLLARSPDDFRGCSNIITYNEHVSTGYQAVANGINFRQRVVGKDEESILGRLLFSIQHSAIYLAFKDLFPLTPTPLYEGYQYMKERRMILKCGLEHEPEKTLALRLRIVDFRRSDLYAVDVDENGGRLETLRLDARGYDSCPLKTFSVLRDPTHDEFRGTARSNGGITLCNLERGTLLFLLVAPLLLVPADGPEHPREEWERSKTLPDNTDWSWQSWETVFADPDWNLRRLVRLSTDNIRTVYTVSRVLVEVAVKVPWSAFKWYMSGFCR